MWNCNKIAPPAKQRIQAGHGGPFWDIGMVIFFQMKVLDIPTCSTIWNIIFGRNEDVVSLRITVTEDLITKLQSLHPQATR